MTVGGVVVVVGAIEVGGHNGNVIRAVLTVQEFAVLETGNFRQGVGLIGLLQFTGKQAAFLHGLRRHAGVDTGGAQELQLLAAVLPGRVDDVHFQRHVVIHEIGQCFLIGHDAADLGSSKEHILRLLLCKKRFHSILTGQVQLLVGAGDDIGVALPVQFPDDCRANHAPVARHINFGTFLHHKADASFRVRSRMASSRSWTAIIRTSSS